MKLKVLLDAEMSAPAGCEDVEIGGLTADSRMVQRGFLFAALAGGKQNGARFVPEALTRGAAVVLAKPGDFAPLPVPVVTAAAPRRALALMASRFYRRQPAVVVAVTGTSGKTSVADFTRQIFAILGRPAASLGTIGLVRPDGSVYGGLTTPDPVALHQSLATLAIEGITHLALEASSHGLDQHRLDGVELAAAAFSNLSRDHLDYHAGMTEYLAAKLRLFTQVLPVGGMAVINADAEHADAVIAAARGAGRKVATVGERGRTLQLRSIARDGLQQRLSVGHGEKTFEVTLPLLGPYQAANALLAAGLALATGESVEKVVPALASLRGVKGRLEVVGRVRGGLVVIDYAHKPDALAAALDALRQTVPGRIVCVFGCGGDRDRGKRPIMGRIAAQKANHVIVTDDNPRNEHPAAIRAAILAAAPGAREIADRTEAIRAGARLLGCGDVLLVAGKGHETGQIVGNEVLPFSDHDAVRLALAEPPINV
jgi:UDP-N-acetylmuramoyl-L-alanyl-D-glutamate--2,6-diaminopimelate ligase